MLNSDTIEKIAESERRRIERIAEAEWEAFIQPDVDRADAEKFGRMPDQERMMLPAEERGRLERLRRRLSAEAD